MRVIALGTASCIRKHSWSCLLSVLQCI